MSEESLTTLADAMLAWTGWKCEASPRRNDEGFTIRYGARAAARWLPILHALEDDFYASDARYVAKDLQDMSERASEEFRKGHPEVDDAVVQALAWCYTFDYK